MPQASPTAVFQQAQSAMAERDWVTFFGCFDRNDLKRLVKNGISLALARREENDQSFETLCGKYEFPLTEVTTAWGSGDSKQYAKVINAALRPVTDLAGFMAALEQFTRRCCGGGSVSSSLFVGEELQNLEIQDERAWATRRITADFSEDIGFILKKERWYIRLFARRPKHP